jgi:hypothetical protein
MTTLQIIIVCSVIVFGLLYWMRRNANRARSRNR